MLVCMGAAIVMAMGHYMQEAFQTGDPARLGAQVISGIGFYSAGILATLAVYLIMARFKKLEYKFALSLLLTYQCFHNTHHSPLICYGW